MDDPLGGPRTDARDAFIRRLIRLPVLDLSRRVPVFGVAGLAVLYACAYMLPLVTPGGSYLLPTAQVVRLVMLPGGIAMVVVGGVILGLWAAACRWATPRVAALGAVLGLTVFAVIALKGIMEASGYAWQEHLPRSRNLATNLRYARLAAFAVVFLGVWSQRFALRRIARMLASLGAAFACLCLTCLVMLGTMAQSNPAATFVGASPARAA